MRNYAHWTTSELRRLKYLCEQDVKIKDMKSYFPRHTLRAIEQCATRRAYIHLRPSYWNGRRSLRSL